MSHAGLEGRDFEKVLYLQRTLSLETIIHSDLHSERSAARRPLANLIHSVVTEFASPTM